MKQSKIYLAKIIQLLEDVISQLSNKEVNEIKLFLAQGDTSEGIKALAWIIHNENKNIDKEIINSISELSDGVICKDEMPPNFRNYSYSK